MAGRQAKLLSQNMIDEALNFIKKGRHPARNRVMFLLSSKAGLRACEIAGLKWSMLITAEGKIAKSIHIEDAIAKKHRGRMVPMNSELRVALQKLREKRVNFEQAHVILSERNCQMSPSSVSNWFAALYRSLGFQGCSSHSGRRTFITNAARAITSIGGSLRDVQELAGHASLTMTERYIVGDRLTQRRIIEMI